MFVKINNGVGGAKEKENNRTNNKQAATSDVSMEATNLH